MKEKILSALERQAPWLAAVFAVFIFICISGGGSPHEFCSRMVADPIEIPAFIAPCVVFGLTTHAYSRFFVGYTKIVSWVSFIFFLIAMWCCSELVSARAWWTHLMYMYLLFFSYVVWDMLMLESLLREENVPKADAGSGYKHHFSEIKIVTNYINRPTLITLFIVWLFSAFYLSHRMPYESVRIFVSGVVSFHLIFSSLAYCIAYIVYHSPRALVLSAEKPSVTVAESVGSDGSNENAKTMGSKESIS